ncbi:MAG TPA: carboxypeptidase-like regulatory domain-containing protein [Thermoguttaceae bacterium]|nr:carboxypeptidase-like regulatory domain-containing protein [Thermoguttaceae bacterium]
MKNTAWLRTMMLAWACGGLLIPSPVVAAAAAPSKPAGNAPAAAPKAFDVELQKNGTLVGQVVNAQGAPQAKMPISLSQGDKTIATIATNDRGFFAVSRVPSGTYRVAAGQTQGVYRLWATGTAPPAAQPGTLLVVGKGPAEVARAQSPNGGSGPIGYWLGNPWVIAGLVAAAVAIPVAIHNYQIDHDTPASN